MVKPSLITNYYVSWATTKSGSCCSKSQPWADPELTTLFGVVSVWWVELFLPKLHVEFLTAGTYKCDLIENNIFEDVI